VNCLIYLACAYRVFRLNRTNSLIVRNELEPSEDWEINRLEREWNSTVWSVFPCPRCPRIAGIRI